MCTYGITNEKKRMMRVRDTQYEEGVCQDNLLIYILQGEMKLQYSEQSCEMKQEDIIVVNANKRYAFQGTGDILYCEIIIPYKMMADTFGSSGVLFWCNSTIDQNESYDRMREIIQSLLSRYVLNQGEFMDFGTKGLYYYLLDILTMNFIVRADERVHKGGGDKYEERIQQINAYLQSNYNQAISLKDLSEQLYLSNAYLSRFFKKHYNKNFTEYLTEIRLFHAVDALLCTEYPITKIALDNGFSNVAVFNKIFKQAYQETPSVFRKRARQDKMSEAADRDYAVANKKLEDYLSREGAGTVEDYDVNSIKAEISVECKEAYGQTWNQMINIGPAEDMLNSEMQKHILFFKEALHYKYARFWNIFSPKMLIYVDDVSKQYNFSKLDAIIDYLLQCELKPFIELGQKPKRVQKSVKKALVYEEEPPIFTHIEQWKSVLTEMTKHMIRRYGKEEVSTWKFEMWYDDRVGRQADGRPVTYFEVFDSGYQIIKGLVPKAEVGGCGSRTTFDMEQFTWLLEEWSKQKCLPDFLSIMSYPYIEGEEADDHFSKRSTDSDYLLHVVDKTRKELERQQFPVQKIYVTEWNQTISDRNYMNDTCYKGAYVMKNVIDTLGKVELLGYFVGSDRFSEHFDSRDLLHGGTGLFSRDGILKPSGFALEFLNNLYPKLITKGRNYIVTTDGDSTYAIACHNYKKLNYYYYLIEEDNVERQKPWQYFENRKVLELHLDLEDIENGEYQVNIQRVNEESGSILDNWRDMDYYSELSREDIKYLRRISEPKRTVYRTTVEQGQISIRVSLQANEIALIKFAKII